MRTVSTRHFKFKILGFLVITLFGVLTIIGSNGGGGGGPGAQPGGIEIETPASLDEPEITGLQVRISLDGRAPIELAVDNQSGSVTVDDIPAGTYQIDITYYVVVFVETILASVTESVSVVAGQVTVLSLNEIDLVRNYDEDSDGYTNLAEVRIGTDAHDASDSPGGGNPLYSFASGSWMQADSRSFRLSAKAGEPVAGVATSINFKITHGLRTNLSD